MNKKAFTLVELLGVVIILIIIGLLVFPNVYNIIKQSRETIYQSQIRSILNAAYDYSLKNTDYLPVGSEIKYLTLGELKYEGLIDANIKNPIEEEEFPNNLVISIRNVGPKYEYDKTLSKMEGYYLYTAEINKLNNTTNLPTINLVGLTKNSNNNYIMTLSLNEIFPTITYTAQSFS